MRGLRHEENYRHEQKSIIRKAEMMSFVLINLNRTLPPKHGYELVHSKSILQEQYKYFYPQKLIFKKLYSS